MTSTPPTLHAGLLRAGPTAERAPTAAYHQQYNDGILWPVLLQANLQRSVVLSVCTVLLGWAVLSTSSAASRGDHVPSRRDV